MNAAELLQTVRGIVCSIDYCVVITHAETGSPNARVMEPFKPDDDWTIWMGTSPKSRKVQDIQRNSRITLTYYYPSNTAYVTLQGEAHLVSDLKLRRKYWNEVWHAFFPDGPEGNDYTLIAFVPDRIEVLDFALHITPPPFGLQPAVLVRQGDAWVVDVL